MRILKRKTFKQNPEMEQLTRESDDLAARFWRQEASSKEQGYNDWLNCIRKGVKRHFSEIK